MATKKQEPLKTATIDLGDLIVINANCAIFKDPTNVGRLWVRVDLRDCCLGEIEERFDDE